MPLYGDIRQIELARAALRELARVPARAARRVAEYLDGEIKRMFAEERDPYGNRWAALAASTVRKKGHDRILDAEGELKDGTGARAVRGSGVMLHVGPNGYWHQVGREGMPARRILPQFGLPAKWRAEIERIVREEVAKSRGRR